MCGAVFLLHGRGLCVTSTALAEGAWPGYMAVLGLLQNSLHVEKVSVRR